MKLDGIYRGKVLATDATTDSKLGRVKVEVYPYLIGVSTARALGEVVEGIATEALPWAYPAFSLFSGSGLERGSFAVPEVGSYVFVFFEAGDVYQPVYFAEAPCGSGEEVDGIPQEALEHYPHTRVFKTGTGITFAITGEEDNNTIVVTHPSGTTISVDNKGTVSISSEKDIIINASNNVSVTAKTVQITGTTEIDLN